MTGVQRVAIAAALLVATSSRAAPLPCLASPEGAPAIDKLLAARVGQAVTILQVCDGGGALVSFWFTRAKQHTAQIVRISNQSTVAVLASWKDMKNCDDGMCDHFSTTDSLEIVNATDVDGDGNLDPLIDFATTTGDQGHENHRFSLWLSKTKHLEQLGVVHDRIEQIETFPDRSGIGIAVSTRTFDGDLQLSCFNRAGAMRACPE